MFSDRRTAANDAPWNDTQLKVVRCPHRRGGLSTADPAAFGKGPNCCAKMPFEGTVSENDTLSRDASDGKGCCLFALGCDHAPSNDTLQACGRLCRNGSCSAGYPHPVPVGSKDARQPTARPLRFPATAHESHCYWVAASPSIIPRQVFAADEGAWICIRGNERRCKVIGIPGHLHLLTCQLRFPAKRRNPCNMSRWRPRMLQEFLMVGPTGIEPMTFTV